MNTELYNKCKEVDIELSIINAGYKWFSTNNKNKPYNLNIIGIRSDNQNKVTNLFDDIMIVEYLDGKGHKTRKLYEITTEPGTYYMDHPLSKKGTAILKEGQYKSCWKIGRHNGYYEALVQCNPVKVFRDNNKDKVYDLNPETIDEGLFGINIHRSNPNRRSIYNDKWSAGCQVFANYKEFEEFMNLCRRQMALYGNSFTYTLLNENQLWE